MSALPTRTNTVSTAATVDSPVRADTLGSVDDDAVPGEDTSAVTKLFHERLQAWKHAIGYLEEYVEATEKLHHDHKKDYEKVLKSVSNPLKEGHHFDQQLGGVAGLFDNLRSNTQGIANSNTETAKTLKGTVLPIFQRLHAEIKNKQKELDKGAGKGSKAVDKARNTTQKQIELLGQHTASFDSTGGKLDAKDDPYVLHRQVRHRLHKQIMEENANKQDLLEVQNSFAQFEAHLIKTVQTGIGELNQCLATQAEQTRNMYGNVTMTAQAIPPDFEWKGFVTRNSDVLIDPGAPDRTVSNIGFPNQDHKSVAPLIAGSLERKGKLLKRYDTGYYVVSASKFLHEFSSDDDFAKDPAPELSLYLPDCTVGAIDGPKFNVKGKDVSKSSIGNKLSMSHELQFKAHTNADAAQWWDIVRTCAGQVTNEPPITPVDTVASPSSVTSPSSVVSPMSTVTEHEKSTVVSPTHHDEKTTMMSPTTHDERSAVASPHTATAPTTVTTTTITHPAGAEQEVGTVPAAAKTEGTYAAPGVEHQKI